MSNSPFNFRSPLFPYPNTNCVHATPTKYDLQRFTTITGGFIRLKWHFMCYLRRWLLPGRVSKFGLACFLNCCKSHPSGTASRTKSPETSLKYRDHNKGTSACSCTAGGSDNPTGQCDPDSDQLEWLLERSVQAGQPGSGSLRFCARAFIRNGVAAFSPLSSALKQIQTLKGSSRVSRGCL